MRTALLVLLLLLGCLQAATAPAVLRDAPDGQLQFRAGPLTSAPTPAENATTLKRLADAPRLAALQGNGKFHKGELCLAPTPAPAPAASSSRTGFAELADATSIRLRPQETRAPPSGPSL